MKDENWPRTPKWLSAARLQEILKGVPEGARLVPNAVGNMAVYSEEWNLIGCIDFLDEGQLEMWDGENE